MRDDGVKPNVISYNAAIDACGKGGQWQKAIELLHEMPQQGLVANLISYSSAVDACSDLGQWQQALELLHKMQHQGIKPDITVYNRLINACQKGGNWQLAVDVLQELQAAGLKPNRITCNCVTDALHAANEHQQAEAMYLVMLQQGLVPHHWSTVRQGMLDFHDFTVGMTAAAMRIVLRDILLATDPDKKSSSDAYVHDVNSDLHIITGHAMHRADKDGSVLQPVIVSMLEGIGVNCYVNADNKGRLTVRSSELQRYVEHFSRK
jgi:pentatricopeptide repeat protein